MKFLILILFPLSAYAYLGPIGAIRADGTTPFTGDVTINAQSDLRLADADSSHYVAHQAPTTVTSNVTLTWPATDGDADQVLQTNGSGVLAWTTVSTSETFPKVQVIARNGAGTSFANATETDVPFATEILDVDNAFSTATFTAPATGTYQFICTISPALDAASATQYYMLLRSVGGTELGLFVQQYKSPTAGTISVTGAPLTIAMTSGDTAKVRFFQADGATRSLQATASNNQVTIIRLD